VISNKQWLKSLTNKPLFHLASPWNHSQTLRKCWNLPRIALSWPKSHQALASEKMPKRLRNLLWNGSKLTEFIWDTLNQSRTVFQECSSSGFSTGRKAFQMIPPDCSVAESKNNSQLCCELLISMILIISVAIFSLFFISNFVHKTFSFTKIRPGEVW